MDFFKRLTELSPELDLTIRMMRKGAEITLFVEPMSEGIKPVRMTGTAEEIDEGFFAGIEKPMEKLRGLVVDLSEFEASVKAASKTKPADSKKETPKAGAANTKAAEKPAPTPAEPSDSVKAAEKEAIVSVFPWPAGSKVIVSAPGKLRAKEGIVNDTEVDENGAVEVEFPEPIIGKQMVAVKDLSLVKKPVDPTLSFEEAKKAIEGALTIPELDAVVEKYSSMKSDLLQRVVDVRRLELDKPSAAQPAPPVPMPPMP